LTVKAYLIFKKRFTVFARMNSLNPENDFTIFNRKPFSEFKLFIIASTFMGICHCWAFEFVGSPYLPPNVPEFWSLIAGFRQLDSAGI
jgi:hypothetical protein